MIFFVIIFVVILVFIRPFSTLRELKIKNKVLTEEIEHLKKALQINPQNETALKKLEEIEKN